MEEMFHCNERKKMELMLHEMPARASVEARGRECKLVRTAFDGRQVGNLSDPSLLRRMSDSAMVQTEETNLAGLLAESTLLATRHTIQATQTDADLGLRSSLLKIEPIIVRFDRNRSRPGRRSRGGFGLPTTHIREPVVLGHLANASLPPK